MDIMQSIYDNTHYILLFSSSLNSAVVAIMGGVAAHADHLSIIDVILILTIGSKFFMQLYFHLGRRGGYLIKHKLSKNSKMEKILNLDNKGLYIYILFYRFLPGLRTVSPFIIGMTRLSNLKFIFIDTIGALIWGITLSLVGYLCGEMAMRLFDDVDHYENIAYIFVFALCVTFLTIYLIRLFYNRNQLRI